MIILHFQFTIALLITKNNLHPIKNEINEKNKNKKTTTTKKNKKRPSIPTLIYWTEKFCIFSGA